MTWGGPGLNFIWEHPSGVCRLLNGHSRLTVVLSKFEVFRSKLVEHIHFIVHWFQVRDCVLEKLKTVLFSRFRKIQNFDRFRGWLIIVDEQFMDYYLDRTSCLSCGTRFVFPGHDNDNSNQKWSWRSLWSLIRIQPPCIIRYGKIL